jgi:hypothetical protein
MKITRLLATAGVLWLSSWALRPAHAQWNAYDAMMSNNSFSRGWVNPYDNTYTRMYQSNMSIITQNAINRSIIYNSRLSGATGSSYSRRRAARIKKMTPRQRTEMERFVKYNGTMYTPSKSVDTASKVAAMFAKNTGTPASQITPALRELWALYVQQAKSQNAPATDLARTMAYCISANYYYYTGGTGVPETQVGALRTKLRDALSEDPKFRGLNNAKKQELNESMVMLTHFAALGFEVIAKKAPASQSKAVREGYKKLAGINLRGILGVDPSRVAFDKDGLVIKSA